MAKKAPTMTSHDASSAFKKKISDSLPLLGYLNSEDKEDLWRFWKTISSAVKIAINGKGDVFETPRKNSKLAKSSRERQLEEYRLQQLHRNAITIYVPVKCSEKGQRKYRVLKLANQKKIEDYFETIPTDGEDFTSNIAVAESDLEYFDFSEIGSTVNVQKDIIAKQDCSSESVDTEMQESVQPVIIPKPNHAIVVQSDLVLPTGPAGATENNVPAKLEKSKPARKVWPVGRPTTRSSSGARMIKDKFPENSSLFQDSKTNVKKDVPCEVNSHTHNGEVSVDSITFYPDVKEEVQEEEDFNITIVPVGNNMMEITHNSTSSLDNQLQGRQASIGQSEPVKIFITPTNSTEQTYSQDIQPETGMPDYEIITHTNIASSEADKTDFQQLNEHQASNDMDIQKADIVPENTSCSVSQSGDSKDQHQESSQSQLTSRNPSDIETIISALEEELKKTGSDLPSITVTASEDRSVPSATEEVSIEDVHPSYIDSNGQPVQIFEGQEIVEVQEVDNVIWTSGEVQIVDPSQIVDGTAVQGEVVYEGQPVEAQYDVVEFEVLADRKQKRGRKKKVKEESTNEKTDVVDRTCPICHRVLNYASSMTAHMRIHTGVRPYSCGQCDRKFTTKANRDRHEATHVGLKPFQCNQCSKSFTEKRSLKIHMRTHTGERPFVCNVCGRGFTQKCTLIVHMDRHTNKKGHLCDLCGKAFRQKCQLDVHVKRHNRQASYPCNECSTKCYTKGDLVRHMIKHTGERPFRCQLCPRAFTRKQYLIDHENQHYGRKPYRCSVCSATFHDMGSCHRHLRKHRQEEDGENGKGLAQSAVLSSSDFHRILEGTQIGQILKLDDGTDALVKAVTSEKDGSTVYHITCLGKSSEKGKSLSEGGGEGILDESANQERKEKDSDSKEAC